MDFDNNQKKFHQCTGSSHAPEPPTTHTGWPLDTYAAPLDRNEFIE